MQFSPKQCTYRQRQVALWRAESEERTLAAHIRDTFDTRTPSEAHSLNHALLKVEERVAVLEELYDAAWEELSAAEQREMTLWQRAQTTAQLLLPFNTEAQCPTTS
jgi:hypothetical protein